LEKEKAAKLQTMTTFAYSSTSYLFYDRTAAIYRWHVSGKTSRFTQQAVL